MSQNASNIHIGPARIFLNVTPPATGVPPTPVPHVDGVPTSGVEVGHTEGDSVFNYNITYDELRSEQNFGVIEVFPTDEMCELKFVAMERTLEMMRMAVGNIGESITGAHQMFYGGTHPNIIQVRTTGVVLTARLRHDPTKFETIMIYRAYSVEGAPFTYSRTTPSKMQITLRGLSDTTRQQGDYLFQLVREI
jgi:hypothetical protein